MCISMSLPSAWSHILLQSLVFQARDHSRALKTWNKGAKNHAPTCSLVYIVRLPHSFRSSHAHYKCKPSSDRKSIIWGRHRGPGNVMNAIGNFPGWNWKFFTKSCKLWHMMCVNTIRKTYTIGKWHSDHIPLVAVSELVNRPAARFW
jgi:hypothetical protein